MHTVSVRQAPYDVAGATSGVGGQIRVRQKEMKVAATYGVSVGVAFLALGEMRVMPKNFRLPGRLIKGQVDN